MPDGDEELEPGSEEEIKFLEEHADDQQLSDEELTPIKDSKEGRRRSGEPMPDDDSVN